MKKNRVVVTGMGLVSCFGNDVENFYSSLLQGKSGVAPITNFPTDEFSTKIAAFVPDFDPGDALDKKQARRVDKFIAYAMVAGKNALKMAGLKTDSTNEFNKEKAGILIGSGMGGMAYFLDNVKTIVERGPKKVSPFFIPYIITNMAGGLLAMDLGFLGPNYSISTACATANYSIAQAAEHIRKGEADLMLAGGVEAAVNPVGLAGFCACRALSQRNEEPEKASRPWDKGRDGFVMGEGAGVLVLESLDHAHKRGAPILAEYLGGGLSCDAYHMTEPRSDGLGVALCIEKALEDAGITADRVNYINAHATSTPAGDMAEINALKKVFTNREKIAINATKSMIGHCLGAAGGIEAITLIESIRHGKVHPNINIDSKEEEIDFFVPREAVDFKIDVGLSNSFGFGGHNSALLFTGWKGK